MARLIWSPQAVEDLEAACEFIARNSEQYASVFAERVVALAESIPQHPLLGSIVPEYDRDDLRERLFHNYRIIYRLRDDAVQIVCICHGARLLPAIPGLS
jgi:plasmid stabilization system protein ParE